MTWGPEPDEPIDYVPLAEIGRAKDGDFHPVHRDDIEAGVEAALRRPGAGGRMDSAAGPQQRGLTPDELADHLAHQYGPVMDHTEVLGSDDSGRYWRLDLEDARAALRRAGSRPAGTQAENVAPTTSMSPTEVLHRAFPEHGRMLPPELVDAVIEYAVLIQGGSDLPVDGIRWVLLAVKLCDHGIEPI